MALGGLDETKVFDFNDDDIFDDQMDIDQKARENKVNRTVTIEKD